MLAFSRGIADATVDVIMEITIKGDNVKRVPTWRAIQQIISEALEMGGLLTRIARSDGTRNYRALGEYQTTFTPDKGDNVHVTVFVG